MANGNNGNTEDSVNRQEQEQQQQQQQQHSDLTGGVVREGGSEAGGGGGGGGSELATDLVGGGDVQLKLDDDAPNSSSSHGGVNDLVADLCLKTGVIGSGGGGGGYSSYMDNRACTSSSSTSSVGGGAAPPPSSFSFKHFLNSSGTVTAPSSTVTSVDTAVQTSTGARPKVPQSVSASYMQAAPENGGAGGGASSASSKMKRSPRFSSFDSQASLAEYAACGSGPGITGSRIHRPDLRLHQNDDYDSDHVALSQVRNTRLYDERLGDDDIFPSAASNLQASSSSGGHTRYVPRSYSSYDTACSSSSTSIASSSTSRRRPLSGNRDLRPNRLVLAAPPPKLKLDLPLDMAKTSSTASGGGSNGGGGGVGGGGGGAGGLPDFVQDHLPDGAPTWCSPPNSPLGAAEAPLERAIGALSLPSAAASQSCSSLPAPPIGASCSLFTAPSCAANCSSSELGSGSTVKMLPDFLADGPILHSSQRLADVAIGLPFNSMDSPPPQQQQQQQQETATLRLENERLHRELQDLRVELQAQSRRAQDSEQQLLQLVESQRRREALANSANAQTTQRLRRQVVQLEAELLAMRASGGGVNRSSSDGAVGGTPSHLDGETIVNTPGGASTSSSTTTTTTTRPPSRTHQLSRDLLRAADNAEQNLRQLLAGVDNLRQMAANLEQQPTAGVPQQQQQQQQKSQSTATPRSPDPYTDFN